MTSVAQTIRIAQLVQAAYVAVGVSDASIVPLPAGFTFVDCLIGEDFGQTGNFGILAEDSVTNQLALACRGSRSLRDWGENFRFFKRPFAGGQGMIEQGWGAIYDSLRWARGGSNGLIGQIGAHSLGGPISTYFGAVKAPGADLFLFESPEPGNAAFVQWAFPRFRSVSNYQNPHDIVPDAPGRWLGYRDLGTVIPLPFGFNPPLTEEEEDHNHSLDNVITALQALAA